MSKYSVFVVVTVSVMVGRGQLEQYFLIVVKPLTRLLTLLHLLSVFVSLCDSRSVLNNSSPHSWMTVLWNLPTNRAEQAALYNKWSVDYTNDCLDDYRIDLSYHIWKWAHSDLDTAWCVCMCVCVHKNVTWCQDTQKRFDYHSKTWAEKWTGKKYAMTRFVVISGCTASVLLSV